VGLPEAGRERGIALFRKILPPSRIDLLEGSGNVGGRVSCPYHGWSYLNDGRV